MKKTLKGKFKPSSVAERDFYRALKKVARTSGHIVESHVDGAALKNQKAMQLALEGYAELIGPWAERQAAKMLEQVMRSNKRAYQAKSKEIASSLNLRSSERNVLQVAQALQREQVGLIKSIPLEAGKRAQDLAFQAALTGGRAAPDASTIDEIQKQLGLSTEVAVSRAQLIAVTETARANASINQARATAVGSKGYKWHNSGDGAVRESHRVYRGKTMQGQVFSWDSPPTLSDGMTGHPGTFPRCRCFAEPIFDD